MQVFKTALRIIRSKPSLLIYVLMPIMLTFFYMASAPTASSSFTQTPVVFAVENLDHDNPLSLALEEVMARNNEPVAYPADPQVLRNQLFYMRINYVLTIPQGYFTDFVDYVNAGPDRAGDPPQLLRIESAAAQSKQMNEIVTRFLTVAAVKLSADPTQKLELLAADLVESLAAETPVQVISGTENWSSGRDFFFRFSAYSITASMIMIVGLLYYSFRDKKVLPRQLASPTSYSRINFGIGAALAVLALALSLIYILTAFAYFGGPMLNPSGLLAMANLFIYTLVALSFGILISSAMKSENSVSVLGNVLPLAFSFFGGVFIPLQYLSKPVQQIANFLPTYWYTKSLDELGKLSSFDWDSIKAILNNYLILAAFGLTFALTAMGISHYLNRQSGENLAVSKKY